MLSVDQQTESNKKSKVKAEPERERRFIKRKEREK
jgi:hypothetical protein